MIYVLFILAVFSATFLNSNISTVLGYENNVTTVAFLPLTLFIIIQLMRKKIVILKKDNNSSRYVLLASILILFFKLSYGQYDMFKTILLFSFIPYTFAMYLEHASCKEKTVLQNVLIALLVTECLLAVYERVTLTVLLSTEEIYSSMNRAGDTWSFRSSALFGHPLGNAMLVSVINIYILSSNLSPLRKISCFAIAIIALLCFNERGNIVITLATSLPLLIKLYNDASKKFRRKILWVCFPLLLAGVVQLPQSDLGGRLFNEKSGKQDNSTMARLEALTAFKYLSTSEVLIGGNNLNDKVADKMDLAAVENGIISILLDYGIILGILLLGLLFCFQKDKLRVYPWWNKWLILLLFYGIGFTNPHLSNPMQWFIFVCAYYAFRPNLKNKVYGRK